MASLFLNFDLRIANAHEIASKCLETLQDMGFDTANLNEGYGRALDFVFDGVISTFSTINEEAQALTNRR